MSALLIAFGGLPGVGKTTLARRLAADLGAVYLRIDSIEEAIRRSSIAPSSISSLDDAGYRVAYAVAEDNLRLDRIVLADSVNPWPLTRQAWTDVARRAEARLIEVEIVCSDVDEHRRRVEGRAGPSGTSVTWQDVIARDYRPWEGEHVTLDTAGRNLEESVRRLHAVIDPAGALRGPPRD